MIKLSFGAEDLGRIRFAFSPLWETVLSVRALSAGSGQELHAPWLRRVRDQLQPAGAGTRPGGQVPVDLELLTALVRPVGYIPDFLHPVPTGRTASFGAELERVAATAPRVVSAELAHLAGHRLAQQGPGHTHRVSLLDQLASRPRPGLARIVAALDRFWQLAVAAYWPRVEALLQADLGYRMEQMANGGIGHMLGNLHPRIGFDRDEMCVVKYYEGRADLGGRGLVLLPSVFAWPDVIVRTADPQPIVTYSPRGLGRLWERHPDTAANPLADVLGQTRAAVLLQLDLPMSTTQLAGLLELTPATLNVHLKALQGAGILSARREGRAVLYSRTPLGEDMATVAGRPADGRT